MRFLEVAKTKYIREGYSQFCVHNSGGFFNYF